ncbi:type IV secretory pathway VirB10-like protein [Arthrobacter pigmenti]|uniref:Type IV secretory pathway VirB10-like protein n=1 Tax=Arthrobacter pigmenti TaxID=271432 RepID=A0A846RTJ1_9MICC|nr:hypothetical protein [Arthrobacter pigmenti]NJC21601.1 type IV secretory pathway VirB10-like protein [Arthrobacter pigmenti]
MEPDVAESFQQQVRTLATLTQDGQTERALEEAAALKADVQAAAAAGTVTAGRADRIEAGIDSFVASLTPVEQTETVPPAPGPSSSVGPDPAPVDSDPPVSPPKQVTPDDRADGEEEDSERSEEEAEEARDQAEDEAKEREKREDD